ncbi:MAG: hypothetical protein R6W92_03355 [Desulfocurvibacter africanus]
MPLNDYSALLERLQRALALAFDQSGEFLNRPGSSSAFKIDPDFYLAILPQFAEDLSFLTGILAETVTETLVLTGNLATYGPERICSLRLDVHLSRSGSPRPLQVGFLQAGFVDGALKLYGGRRSGLPLSDVRLNAAQRPLVERFLAGRPVPASISYAGEMPPARPAPSVSAKAQAVAKPGARIRR